MSAPVLEIDGLTIAVETHGARREVVSDVSLRLDPGEVLALVGESGSGKTMTMSAVLGLLPRPAAQITAGSIRFDGQDLLALPLAARRNILRRDIAFITQNSLTSLDPSRRILSQLAGMIGFRNGIPRREARLAAADWLERVGIRDVPRVLASYPHELSGGMRQRVVIAMAISSQPRLLIADEPTTALDTTTQKQVLDLLLDINRSTGTAILLITHDFGVVSWLSQRVAVLYQGRLVETAPLQELLDAPRHDYSRKLIASVPELDLGDRPKEKHHDIFA